MWSHITAFSHLHLYVSPPSLYICVLCSLSYFQLLFFVLLTYIMLSFSLSGISMTQSGNCRTRYNSCLALEREADKAEVLDTQCSLRNDTIHCLKPIKDDSNCLPMLLQVSTHLNTEIKEFCQFCHHNSSTHCDPPAPPLPTVSPTPPPEENCSSLPSSYPIGNHDLGVPSLVPPPTSRDCTMSHYATFHRQQCSIYTLSHIRSFGDRKRNVETCFLPGWWYLMKHQWLEVVVKGEAMYNERSGIDYTVVSEVSTVAAWG